MFRYLSLIVFLSLFLVSNALARTVTDMAGRRVVIPDRIERVVGLSPPAPKGSISAPTCPSTGLIARRRTCVFSASSGCPTCSIRIAIPWIS